MVLVTRGNIAVAETDAIVNAANEHLAEGAGVCGAIFGEVLRRGGPGAHTRFTEACQAKGHCPTGDAVSTPSFALPSAHVIHAVGPVWRGRRYSAEIDSLDAAEVAQLDLLASTYRAVFRECRTIGARSVTIPAISTGIYGLPKRLGHAVALMSADAHAGDIQVELIAYDEASFTAMQRPVSAHVSELLASVAI